MTTRIVPLGANGFIPSFNRRTMSFLVLNESEMLLLDAGTGVARLLEPHIVDLIKPYDCLNVILSHYHLDHVVGLSYLLRAWTRGRVRIYAPGRPLVEAAPEEALNGLLRPPLFPLMLQEFPTPVEVVPVTRESLQTGTWSIRLRAQTHAGGSAAIRIGDEIAYVTDTIVDEATSTFARGVKLLLHEVFLTDAEAENGDADRLAHSYPSGVARIARQAGVGCLMPVHHHPERTDAEIRQLAHDMETLAGIEVIVPEEGRVYQLPISNLQYSTPNTQLLRQVPFLEPLTPEQRATLASGAELHEYEPGSVIVREGSGGDSFFIIESGQVVVYKELDVREPQSNDGEMVELARLTPGDFFGEIALLEDTPRSASVRTDTQVRVFEISRPSFKRLLGENLDVAFAVMQTLSRRLRETDQKMIEGLLRKNEELQLAHRRLEQSYDTTLITLSNALDLRDAITEGHSLRVAEIAVQIGQAMGLSERQLEALRRGGLLHDVGKIGVPDAILHKPGKLSPEEWEIMHRHPVWGAEILSHIDFLAEALPLVLHHHEAWDGSGYPDGLRGAEIPLLARIFAVADAYDAITNDRLYRKNHSPEEALAVIRGEAGRQFDPAIVAALERLFPTIREE